MPRSPQGALSRIRVIDITQTLAGPYCSMMLADQGAEVIKVEPLSGEPIRRTGPFHTDDSLRAFGGYFASINRGKKGLAVDLKAEAGQALVRRLIATADVVVENYRAGVLDRLGLAYETLRDANPRLVYASIRGFGDPRTGESPYASWPAYDVIAQAMGGIMGITGPDAASPTKIGPGVGDLIPGMMSAFGVVCAVLEAQRTGRGQYVDVAMLDAVLAVCERIVYQHSFQGVVPRPEGNRHPLLSPFGVVACRDGAVTIAAFPDDAWKTLCGLMDRPDLATDPRTATADARTSNQDLVYSAIEDFTRPRTKAELTEILGGKVPFGPIYQIDDIVRDPHFAARRMIAEVEHPGMEGKVAIAASPIRLTETPGPRPSRAPLVGEHTDEILRDVGYDAGEIAALRRDKVIG